jgi:hypothetical protein
LQALNHPPVDQVLIDDFVNILLIDIAVPDVVGIDHYDRTFTAAIQTPGSIDTDFAGTGDTQFLAALFRVIAHCLGIEALTAGGTVGAQVNAEEDMISVVGHTPLLYRLAGKKQAATGITVAVQRLSGASAFLYL